MENKQVVTSEDREGGRGSIEVGNERYKLLGIKKATTVLFHTGEYSQYFIAISRM